MKDSGISWLPQIPYKWEQKRLKDIGFLFGGLTGKSGEDFNVEDDCSSYMLYIPFTNIFNNLVIRTDQLYKVKVDDGEIQNLVKGNDLLFLMSSEDLDGVGKPSIIEVDIPNLGLNSFCKGLRITDINTHPKFLLYYLTSHIARELVRQEAKGFIRINLRQDKLSCCPILVPPLPEQQAIADFLDEKCSEIDELVALQEKMIDELKAYKQSVITEAVTKGLDPNVPMKDSGIDWIGEIPEEWDTQRLRFLSSIATGDSDTQDAESGGIYPFYVRSPFVERSNKWTFEGEGILMAGDGAGAGRVFHHAFGKYAVHQRVYRISDIAINSYYLFYFISSLFSKVMDMGSAQSTVPSVRLPMLTNFMVCVPPSIEQLTIATYLDQKCSEIDSLIKIKQDTIEALKEYKRSIIYEYVTGKKEVV